MTPAEVIHAMESAVWIVIILGVTWLLCPRNNLPICDECVMQGHHRRLSWLLYPWRGKFKCPDEWKYTDKDGQILPEDKDDQYFCFKCYRNIKDDLKKWPSSLFYRSPEGRD